MKIKTADLVGPALDWAVAQLEGKVHGYKHQLVDDCRQVVSYSPSTNWSQGGPLIAREGIEVGPAFSGTTWVAGYPNKPTSKQCWSNGPTPLIAAMRCYVASKLGDEVEVPDELM